MSESDFRAGYGQGSIGTPKVEAFGHELVRLNEDVNYRGYRFEVSKANSKRLSEVVSRCNVAGLMFDDFPGNFRLASDLVCPHMPAVAAFQTENLGEVAWSIPGQTPDLACTVDVERKKQISGGVATAYVLQMTALVAVRVLEELLYLCYKSGEYKTRFIVPGRNLIYVGWGADDVIQGPGDVVLQARTIGVYGTWRMRNPSCSVCRSYLEREVHGVGKG